MIKTALTLMTLLCFAPIGQGAEQQKEQAAGDTLTLDQALAAVRQSQVAGEGFKRNALVALVFTRWPKDPMVIAFYQDALATRGREALEDLATFSDSPWDDSYAELVTALIEKDAFSDILLRGVELLDRRYSSWARNPAIGPRLTKAIVRVGPKRLVNGSYNYLRLLGLTHDRGAITVLEPFLDDQTIEGFTTFSSNMPYGVTPMRYSDLAANAIARLLGEPQLVDSHKRAAMPAESRNQLTPVKPIPPGPYPEWSEWNRKIVALKERLKTIQR